MTTTSHFQEIQDATILQEEEHLDTLLHRTQETIEDMIHQHAEEVVFLFLQEDIEIQEEHQEETKSQ